MFKYKIERIRRKVRVFQILENSGHTIALTKYDVDEITAWIEEHQMGRRVAWDQWQLNSNEAVTMFMIRYG